MNRSAFEAIVVGGGFFGASIALRLRQHGLRVLLVEKGADLLTRASYANQARVHRGYHYPRSLLTGLRSAVNYPRFVHDYKECICSSFTQVYAVARSFSKVTADYFELFCRRVGVPLTLAPAPVVRLFNPAMIERVFLVDEVAMDTGKLRQRMRRDLERSGVEVRLRTAAERVEGLADGSIRVHLSGEAGHEIVVGGRVFNCTYSALNRLLSASGLPTIPVKHELAEIALVEVPAAVREIGVTVMCGPFFSCMPYPARHLHSLSHVRYTPHSACPDTPRQPAETMDLESLPRKTNFPHMVRDSARYLPVLKDCRYRDSLWEIKTVLPSNEANDGRPILFQKDWGIPNLYCVLGGKIDNIYDALAEADELLTEFVSAA